MKKSYKTPSVEVVKFQYSEQVVAASGERPMGTKYPVEGYNQEECRAYD